MAKRRTKQFNERQRRKEMRTMKDAVLDAEWQAKLKEVKSNETVELEPESTAVMMKVALDMFTKPTSKPFFTYHTKSVSDKEMSGFKKMLDKLYTLTGDESVKAFGETLAIASEVTMRNFCLRRGLHYGAALHGRLIFCVMHLNNSKLLHK